MRAYTLLLSTLLTIPVSLHAVGQTPQEAQYVERRAAQSFHTHGVAELLVVLENKSLRIELHSPAMNLLGFEHRASTPEQRAKVKATREALSNAGSLFQIDQGQCRLITHIADFSGVNDDHAHDGNDETEHHADHHRDGHHSEITADYHYRCAHPDKIHSLTTDVHSIFPDIQDLQVQWIVQGRQGATTLDNTHHHITFR